MIRPTVMSYSIAHYAKDYLAYALRSVSSLVDHSFVFHTNHPSHGHSVQIPPIETRDEIMSSIPANEWNKLTWVDTEAFWYEGPQRDYAVKTLEKEGASLILVLDYDEIYHPEVLEKILDYVWRTNSARNHLLNFYGHFWRSFNYICKDDGWPVRVIDTRHNGGHAYIPKELGPTYHFGYCISNKILEYKLSIHGHRDELRPNWIQEKWNQWPPPNDCHPTNGKKDNGEGWWNPEPFNKYLLPEVMHSHPYFNLEKVE